MNKRGAGVVFCFISAFLYVARYVSAAIFGSNLQSLDGTLFNAMLEYVGTPLRSLSIISLVVGIVYLILAEKEDIDLKAKQDIKM